MLPLFIIWMIDEGDVGMVSWIEGSLLRLNYSKL